mgnify:CR=1 FL=1
MSAHTKQCGIDVYGTESGALDQRIDKVWAWKGWMLALDDVLIDGREISDEDLKGLPEKTGTLSFWNDSGEDIYNLNDGVPIE